MTRPPKGKGPAIAGKSLAGRPRGGLFGGNVLGFVHRRVVSIDLGDGFVDSRFAFDRRRFFDGGFDIGRPRVPVRTNAQRGPACATARATSPSRRATARPPSPCRPS